MYQEVTSKLGDQQKSSAIVRERRHARDRAKQEGGEKKDQKKVLQGKDESCVEGTIPLERVKGPTQH